MAAKETRQQIIENTRKKVAGQYAEQVRKLKAEKHEYWQYYLKAQKEIGRLNHEKSELEMKVKEQEDWIERLITFVNMPPDERERELATMRQQQANAEAEAKLFISPFVKMYEKYLSEISM